MDRAKSITDNIAIQAAHSLAKYASERGINPENIIPNMNDVDVFSLEAADLAMQTLEETIR